MSRRYDCEYPTAQSVVDYLNSLITPEDLGACVIVSFFDPMSIDEADRVIVDVPSAVTDAACAANFDGTVEVTVKTKWGQPTLAADFQRHRDRVNLVRDKLMSTTLADDLSAVAAGVAIDHAKHTRYFRSSTKTDSWFLSEMRFDVSGHWVADQT